MINPVLLNAAIVVLSEGNNPRLLNPDFLDRNEIVPKAWKVMNVLVTPPFAQVSYANGLQVFVEENKLQFVCSLPDAFEWMAELPRIAIAYLTVLPHVSYRAVGHNFTFKGEGLTAHEAASLLTSEMLKQGPWLSLHGGVTGTVLELQYRSSPMQLNVKIGVGEEAAGGNGKGKPGGIMLSINFHHDFQPDQKEERIAFIDSIKTRYAESREFFKALPM